MLNTKQAGQWSACFLDPAIYLFVDTKEKLPLYARTEPKQAFEDRLETTFHF